MNRLPKQQPFEVVDDLVDFTAVQFGVDASLIEHYRRRRQTTSEHQRAIVVYLGMRDFGAAEATLLTLVLACIVYWQAREISRAISQCDPATDGIDLSLLEHVSPIEWDNIVLYGQYILDRKLVRRRRWGALTAAP